MSVCLTWRRRCDDAIVVTLLVATRGHLDIPQRWGLLSGFFPLFPCPALFLVASTEGFRVRVTSYSVAEVSCAVCFVPCCLGDEVRLSSGVAAARSAGIQRSFLLVFASRRRRSQVLASSQSTTMTTHPLLHTPWHHTSQPAAAGLGANHPLTMSLPRNCSSNQLNELENPPNPSPTILHLP